MMRAALALARRSLGRTWPNPAVGCVIVKDGRSSARGRTQDGGRPHAEVDALHRPASGARRHGLRHARAVLAFRQVAALRRCADRGRRRAGRVGAGGSQSAGERPGPRPAADAASPSRSARARARPPRSTPASCCACATGRPLFHLKLATVARRRIATASGESKWITGEAARADGHRLRATTTPSWSAPTRSRRRSRADLPPAGLERYSPVRIVLDSKARLSPGSKLARRPTDCRSGCSAPSARPRRGGLRARASR
jgi:diaminohydroxyphosphoribosylaminopyrimidine deaminase/5-amino-6-(5-phosphoribosylamino)uracil reductase